MLSRRAYDIAASTLGGVKVYLNGTRIPIKGLKDYVDMYLKDQTDETGQAIKCHYESCGERWQVAVAPSSDGFQQMSFVNSIATTKGNFYLLFQWVPIHVQILADEYTIQILTKFFYP